MSKNRVRRSLSRQFGHLAHPLLFVKNIYADTLLEDFFVSAVASMLAIRLILNLTGFPQLGSGPLHFAHMLWGGLFMLVALVVMLAFLDHGAKVIAAVIGGIGFGAFIDELGKFITSDNNYFFQPTVAIIYVIFVLIFFALRALGSRQSLSEQERIANVLDIAKQASLSGLNQEEKDDALKLLSDSRPSALRDSLEQMLKNAQTVTSRRRGPITRIRAGLDSFYEWAASKWWFSGIVVAFFAFTAVTSIYAVVAQVKWSLALSLWIAAGGVILAALLWSRQIKIRYFNIAVSFCIVAVSTLLGWAFVTNFKGVPNSIVDWAQFVFPGISAIYIAAGILILPRSRLQAYETFRWAILISIFLIDVLAFYRQQMLAVLGLFGDIVILVALRYLIDHEKLKKSH